MRFISPNQFLKVAPLFMAAKVLTGCGQEGTMMGDGGIPPLNRPQDGGGMDASRKQKFLDCYPNFRLELISQGLGSVHFGVRPGTTVAELDEGSGLTKVKIDMKWESAPANPEISALAGVKARNDGEPMENFGYGNIFPSVADRLGLALRVTLLTDLGGECGDIQEMTIEGAGWNAVQGDYLVWPEVPVFAYTDGRADDDMGDEIGNVLKKSVSVRGIKPGEETLICSNDCIFEVNAADLEHPTPTGVAVTVRR